ncbi:MAG: hypothetical protein B7Y39_06310 [Bdellovibrio sp. 28-41-41]|nr:MAG: hypothetical protein B7Y39_06310 [Bdellovibrio sp. 28-41-41]
MSAIKDAINVFAMMFALIFSANAFSQIKNFHPLSDQIVRSAAPTKNSTYLKQTGFTHVLIFKNEVKDEVSKEIADLQKVGIPAANIYHVPFKWKDLGPVEDSCVQIVQALDYLVKIEKSRSHKILFHCTAGEDRTGALAGLYRMLYDRWNIDRAFKEEMCAHGYEAGDKGKPQQVVNEVREEVTPVFLAVAGLIIDGKISFNNLNTSACRAGGFKSATYSNLLSIQKSRYTCR